MTCNVHHGELGHKEFSMNSECSFSDKNLIILEIKLLFISKLSITYLTILKVKQEKQRKSENNSRWWQWKHDFAAKAELIGIFRTLNVYMIKG